MDNLEQAKRFFLEALTLQEQGELSRAERLYRKALGLAPDRISIMNNLAAVCYRLEKYAEAEGLCKQVLKSEPGNETALLNLGGCQMALGASQAALDTYEIALRNNPDNTVALNNFAEVLRKLKRPADALKICDQVISLKADFAEAHVNRGNALQDMKRYEDALGSHGRAIAIRPDYADAHYNRGNVLRSLGCNEEAVASYDRAQHLKPDHVDAYINRGNALRDLGRIEAALASYDRALAAKPDCAEAYCNRGAVLATLKRPGEALASYERALAIDPDYADAYSNRGVALAALKCLDEALSSYDRALALKPDYADALNNRGNVLREMQRYEAAGRNFQRLLELAPDYAYACGSLLQIQLSQCDWAQFEQTVAQVTQAVRADKRAATPLTFLLVSGSSGDQLHCARIFAAQYFSGPVSLWKSAVYQHDRLRVAYVSADFRDHAVSYLLARLFERHDRSRFEVMAISFRSPEDSATGRRVAAAFERFIDVSGMSDAQVVALLRELEVDIAVDLMGFTLDSRTAIFAQRCAPVQVSYLGYPGTLGADYMDYILADRFVIPEDQRAHYAEQVVYMPDCFQGNDDQRRISEAALTRAEAGLPESGVVFCSFNNSYKLNPPLFDVWMRLLAAVPGSVLWLVADNASVPVNLRREAQQRGVAPERLVFASKLPYAEHLARLRLADLFLDTLPFNAGTTASDALWAGVPVLTCAGEAFASRMAGSLLHAVGLPEMITHSLEDYEARALELAATPALLAGIRAKLARNRTTHPLFNTDRFRRHLEAAYVTMWGRCQRGDSPASFTVEPILS